MKAELISIGTELLLGEILDTNAQYLAARLPPLGIDLYYVSKVGDNLERLTEVIERAWRRSDLAITTGGLGPTEDDLTREAIARVLGEELSVDPGMEEQLRAFFSRRGVAMPERNVKQATLIPSARALPTPRGPAPGWWVEREGRVIVALPGPPVEMEYMWEQQVAPELERRLAGRRTVLVARVLKTVGLGEGHVDELVSPLLKSTNPTIGVYARADGVQLRIAAKAPTKEEAWRLIEPVEAEVRRLLGDIVWGADDDTLEGAVGGLLRQHGLTLATMESCTGGLLANVITNVPGSSTYFRGGLVAYATEMKIDWGVDPEIIARHGVISAECARDMARAVRERLRADIGIGITGVAGPDPQEEKPPGTIHIGLDAGFTEPQSVSYQFAQGREAVKRRAVTTALALLRRTILDWQGRPAG
ncbi:MAG: competence/damage-inducible protein A [Chloroflexi bacterium RBG_16_68_14]|nr:MAG: competence/damage-inducible protein A [Chloroflexi bacterium RBG_16_68_14]